MDRVFGIGSLAIILVCLAVMAAGTGVALYQSEWWIAFGRTLATLACVWYLVQWTRTPRERG